MLLSKKDHSKTADRHEKVKVAPFCDGLMIAQNATTSYITLIYNRVNNTSEGVMDDLY